jgi:hypothetical protein
LKIKFGITEVIENKDESAIKVRTGFEEEKQEVLRRIFHEIPFDTTRTA